MRISRQLAIATVVVALFLATTAVVAPAQSPPGKLHNLSVVSLPGVRRTIRCPPLSAHHKLPVAAGCG